MLDPHQMVLSAVPDKLLIMTYLHQIKQYFTTRKTTADDHDDDVTMETIAEAERNLRLNTETLINDIENNDFTKVKPRKTDPKTDTSKGVITDTSEGDRNKVEYEVKSGYNPFDEDEAIAEEDIDFTEGSLKDENRETKSADKLESKESKLSDNKIKDEHNSDTISKKLQENPSQNSTRKVENENWPETKDKNSPRIVSGENHRQEKEKSVEKVPKHSPKEREVTENDPWKRGDHGDSTNRNKTKDNDTVPTKPGRLKVQETKPLQETVLYSPKPGYNPFLDEEAGMLNAKPRDTGKPKSENDISEETKLADENSKNVKPVTEKTQSLNPFDDDYVDDAASDSTDTVSTVKSNSLNPFDDDYEEPFETDLDKVPCEKNVGDSDGGLGVNRAHRDMGTSDSKLVDRSLGTNDDNRIPGTNVDKTPVSTDIDDVTIGNTSPRIGSNRLQKTTDNRPDSNVCRKDKNASKIDSNNTSPARSRILPKTDNSPVRARPTENVQVTQMHRKEPRRPATLTSKVRTRFVGTSESLRDSYDDK